MMYIFGKLLVKLESQLFKLFSVKLFRNPDVIIGKHVRFIGFPILSVYKNSKIDIGNNCLFISKSLYTDLGVSRRVIFRTLSHNSSITIGDGVRASGVVICSKLSVNIGKGTVIGSDVIIADTDFHSLNHQLRSTEKDKLNAKSKAVKIGNNVFIGTKSIILKGVSIGNESVVGAGSVVTKSFGPNSIIAGNPAKQIN